MQQLAKMAQSKLTAKTVPMSRLAQTELSPKLVTNKIRWASYSASLFFRFRIDVNRLPEDAIIGVEIHNSGGETMKNKIILGCLAAADLRDPSLGSVLYFTKWITAQARGLALISWRFVTAFLLRQPLSSAQVDVRIVINGRNLKPLTRIAILNPIIYFICETIGIRMTTASEVEHS